MNSDIDIRSLSVSSLPFTTKRLLCLLDTPKIIPSDGPDKLPRDWRGIATLVKISAETAAVIQQYEDRTSRVLNIWQQQEPTATIGQLLDILMRLDRFDVYDDVCSDLKELGSRNQPLVNQQNQICINNNNENKVQVPHTGPITYDDQPGYEHRYHAFVLYAKEDQEFVDELLQRLDEDGFQICTVDRLQAGHSTQYAPVAKLISERCERIILVCSPDFVSSPANKFYSNYAQAVSIETTHKLLPIMYRKCELPPNLTFYHQLHYKSNGRAMYDFWHKLKQSLSQAVPTTHQRYNPAQLFGPNGLYPSRSAVGITEMASTGDLLDYDKYFLPSTHRSMDSLPAALKTEDSKSLSCISQISSTSEGKKKKSSLIKLFNNIRNKKTKKTFTAAN